MKTSVLVMLMALALGLAGNAQGGVFNVSTLAEFENALNMALANGGDDTIHVTAKTYNLITELTVRFT